MYKTGIILTVTAFCAIGSLSFNTIEGFQNKRSLQDTVPVSRWQAPALADTLKSPVPLDQAAEDKGAETYELYCKPCHGDAGFGDGGMGASLAIKPADFHSKEVTEQKNGALFWKMSTGRGAMPSFKDVLTSEQRWQLVAFIRGLSRP